MNTLPFLILMWSLSCTWAAPLHAQSHVYLLDVPDYNWSYGCFGTACGNLIGFWDRSGLPDLYRGPAGGGVAPLGETGSINALWATKAGVGGRPADQPGHVDDYWVAYDSTVPDPHVTAQRTEHAPDCLNDFTGVNQYKWPDLNGECEGNVDGFGFVFWETNGVRRVDFTALDDRGVPVPDIPSGLREWARHTGYEAEAP